MGAEMPLFYKDNIMDKVQFVKDCLTDYLLLQNKTVDNADRFKVMDTIKLEYPAQFHHLELLSLILVAGSTRQKLFDSALDGLAKLVAKIYI